MVNILLSFAMIKGQAMYRTICETLAEEDPASFRVMIDSGAFTAWNTGKPIALDDYVRFLRGLPSEWDMSAIQLDVIGDPKASLRNFEKLHGMGVETIPVFTRGTPIAWREKMYAKADLVALGGLVGNRQYLPFMRHFMETNKKRRVHWLGYTDTEDVKRYRPTSVDSTSIINGQRYGQITYYAGAGVFKKIDRRSFTHANKQLDVFIAASRRLRFTMTEIRKLGLETSWNGDIAGSVEAPEFIVERSGVVGTGLASFVNFAHAVAYSIDVERHVGTHVYHALVSPRQVQALFTARNFLIERGALGWATQQEALA